MANPKLTDSTERAPQTKPRITSAGLNPLEFPELGFRSALVAGTPLYSISSGELAAIFDLAEPKVGFSKFIPFRRSRAFALFPRTILVEDRFLAAVCFNSVNGFSCRRVVRLWYFSWITFFVLFLHPEV